MQDYTHPLGDAVKMARESQGLTQRQVADMIGVDVRTIIKIENYKANPQLKVLYPLIRALKIDPNNIFYPNIQRDSSSSQSIFQAVDRCTEAELSAVAPVIDSLVNAIKEITPEKIDI